MATISLGADVTEHTVTDNHSTAVRDFHLAAGRPAIGQSLTSEVGWFR